MRRSTLNIVLSMSVLAIGVASATGGPVRQKAAHAENTSLGLRNERVSINLPENGMLGECRYGEQALGVRWPGGEGLEFFGSGGFFLSFRLKETGNLLCFGPADFNLVEKGSSGQRLFEGCSKGKRYPTAGCDDDEDGSIDEDPLDGLDNDGDGQIDEDFAAIGHEMTVSRASIPETGLYLTQNSFVWSFGHVRDFVGFTSRIEYSPDGDGPHSDLLDVEIAQQIDFDIGRGTDQSRGNNDDFFLARQKPVSGDGKEAIFSGIFGVAAGGEPESPFAAVIIFQAFIEDAGATGVGGSDGVSRRSVRIEPARLARPVDDPTEFLAEYSTGKGPDHRARGDKIEENANVDPDFMTGKTDPYKMIYKLGEGFEREAAITGDYSIINSLGRIETIKPGEVVRVEWGLVFGRSGKQLAANAVRAIQTYRGVDHESGGWCRWIVPARKAANAEVVAKLVPVWIQGKRMPAVSVELPGESDEDVEWLKIAGVRRDDYRQMYGRVMVTIMEDLPGNGGPLIVEGQMSCGTLFRGMIDQSKIAGFAGEESTEPDKLPDESLRTFPNPFVTDLNIRLSVQKQPSTLYSGQGESLRGISSVKIYDVTGRLVRTVIEEEFLNPGDYSMGWDRKDENGVLVQPGVYYCKLQIGDKSVTKRVVLLR